MISDNQSIISICLDDYDIIDSITNNNMNMMDPYMTNQSYEPKPFASENPFEKCNQPQQHQRQKQQEISSTSPSPLSLPPEFYQQLQSTMTFQSNDNNAYFNSCAISSCYHDNSTTKHTKSVSQTVLPPQQTLAQPDEPTSSSPQYPTESPPNDEEFHLPDFIYSESGRRRAVPFTYKLYKVLSMNEYSEIIHWSPDGKSFRISDRDALVAYVLPLHFKNAKYESFQRKLLRWNFRLRKGFYSNENFQKDRIDLLSQMACRGGPTTTNESKNSSGKKNTKKRSSSGSKNSTKPTKRKSTKPSKEDEQQQQQQQHRNTNNGSKDIIDTDEISWAADEMNHSDFDDSISSLEDITHDW